MASINPTIPVAITSSMCRSSEFRTSTQKAINITANRIIDSGNIFLGQNSAYF
jgi:hypothetical protein